MNEARKHNNKAVVEEQERLTDPNYEKRRTKQEFYTDSKAKEEVLKNGQISKDKSYIYDDANRAN